jgi:hypothetical protein
MYIIGMQSKSSNASSGNNPPAGLELVTFRGRANWARPGINWIWQGYLAPGSVTLLTSQWKSGKTTLVSVLFTRMQHGGELASLSVRKSRAVVISEEAPEYWYDRCQRLDFGNAAGFYCRPFESKPTHTQWKLMIERLARLRDEEQTELVVIDTLASFLPCGCENQADAMLEALRPLEMLTAKKMAVLILHHPRKGRLQAGQAARGTGALGGYVDILVDILVEMRLLERASAYDRRRRLSAWSRHNETPRDLVIELNAEGNDYAVCPDAIDEEFERGVRILRELLAAAEEQLTRADLLKLWPDRPKPSSVTLWRWLDKCVARALVQQHGNGDRSDPFRYTLPGLDLPVGAK